MHTVIETAAYIRAAKLAGIDADTLQAIVDRIVASPEAGEIMPGCGVLVNCGWRGRVVENRGYRVVTYFTERDSPVFLLTIFPKNVKTNLTNAEQNAFADACKRLTDSLKGQ